MSATCEKKSDPIGEKKNKNITPSKNCPNSFAQKKKKKKYAQNKIRRSKMKKKPLAYPFTSFISFGPLALSASRGSP